MDRITFFEGLRSLVNVAEDIIDAIVVEVETLLDEVKDEWEKQTAPQEPDAKQPPTREEKAQAIVDEWNRRGTYYGQAWRPSSPQFKDVPDYIIDQFYGYLLTGQLP